MYSLRLTRVNIITGMVVCPVCDPVLMDYNNILEEKIIFDFFQVSHRYCKQFLLFSDLSRVLKIVYFYILFLYQ